MLLSRPPVNLRSYRGEKLWKEIWDVQLQERLAGLRFPGQSAKGVGDNITRDIDDIPSANGGLADIRKLTK